MTKYKAMNQLKQITIAHTPDADDAFMFYALTAQKLSSPDLEIVHLLKPIQELNEAAKHGTYEMSALSFAAYPTVADQYSLMSCGACMGYKHGPMLLAKRDLTIADLSRGTIAIPGKMTTAYMLFKIFQPNAATVEVPFDQIVCAISEGKVDAGLVIHEAQLTYERHGLKKIVDLGQWWFDETRLPLPLGGNVLRKDLGPRIASEITKLFRESIRYALTHREEAVNFALPYARGMAAAEATKFIGRYVNELTLDYGDVGSKALAELFKRAYEHGAIDSLPQLEFAILRS
jgi:1,4-dihydroxy-6-naphthoate synthase